MNQPPFFQPSLKLAYEEDGLSPPLRDDLAMGDYQGAFAAWDNVTISSRQLHPHLSRQSQRQLIDFLLPSP
ncbi:hypothetical protein C1X59_18520 [Pseudomonas sp. FW215-R2]|nr:hypothetical protein C1X59_18520 [Pseudomonas sp. FW215-R2]PMX09877.1 hypothetical protein C1X60_13070 [Pseudomonas sp. FW215-L1]PMX23003.1 hypothetical protein C1X57_13460 [Pseudomonas sp. FW215-E1]PNA29856.1 hypothetical protein C1X58_13775 [Pseudomonas sp. FW215-R4]